MHKVSCIKLFCLAITGYHLLSTRTAMLLTYHTHPYAHTFGTLTGVSHELIYVHTFIIIIYLFAAHNIPLQVNTDDGNMEMDISQGEVPKTNEQAENVMR